MLIPSPTINKHTRQYLVIDGRLTNAGKKFLKIMSVYWKSNKTKK